MHTKGDYVVPDHSQKGQGNSRLLLDTLHGDVWP